MPTDFGTSDWILTCVVLILGVALGTWFRIGPGKRSAAVADAILGEEEVRDRSGNVIRESQPGLVHLQRDNSKRLGKVEDAVEVLTEAVQKFAAVDNRINGLDGRVTVLEQNQVKDIINAAERAATAASSAQMLAMMRDTDTDTIDGESTETQPPEEIGG